MSRNSDTGESELNLNRAVTVIIIMMVTVARAVTTVTAAGCVAKFTVRVPGRACQCRSHSDGHFHESVASVTHSGMPVTLPAGGTGRDPVRGSESPGPTTRRPLAHRLTG